MEVDPPNALQQQQPYAILRIKRKRNEEPLDALVVESAPRRKRSKGGLNVFQYAGTVEQAAWNDEQQKKELEKRLAGLARESTQKKMEESAPPPPPAAPAAAPPHGPAPVATTAPAAAPASPVKAPSAPVHPPMRTQYAPPSKTYTIVPQEQIPAAQFARKHHATAPPKVYSSKEVEEMKRGAAFKMYDAVPSSSSTNFSTTDTDKELEKFLPLLKDYLNVNDVAPPSPVPAPQATGANGESMDEDYVYDVFYQRPTTFAELYEPGAGSNIARLTGLPPELSGLYGEDESDEEYEDEDDEDSNAEDWYTNDYPEEEEPDPANEFHEQSDFEDVMHGGDRDLRTYGYDMASEL
ncbi:hypothetical protein BD414DRAFT_426682 [Trametes punicea]|nr:hypothetical protein BD414DRAFT_426682 [Trametes punicea]